VVPLAARAAGAIANAIYNATGVRASHRITAEDILMGLKKQRGLT
jgi:hypothetical protein